MFLSVLKDCAGVFILHFILGSELLQRKNSKLPSQVSELFMTVAL